MTRHAPARAGSHAIGQTAGCGAYQERNLPLGIGPDAVAVSPDGSRLYTSNPNADSVSVIDTTTNTVTGTVGVGNGPKSVTVSPDGARAYTAYTADAGGDSVSVIETEQ